MKKPTILFLIIGIIISLCSCSNKGTTKIVDNDHLKAKETIESVLKAVQNKDTAELKSLFAKNALSKIQSFDISAEELFKYFDGNVKSFDDGAGPYVETAKEDGDIFQLMESSFDVTTESNKYRFAMQFITKGDKNDIGIVSLSILNAKDDKNPEYAYWGDSLFAPGIHVAVPNEW